jgi:hypothetical protein
VRPEGDFVQSNRLALVAPLSIILAAAGATNFACSNSDDDNNNGQADAGVYIDGGIQQGVPPGSGYMPPAGGDDDDDDDDSGMTGTGGEGGTTPPADAGDGGSTLPPTDAGDSGGGGSGAVVAVLVIGDGTNPLAATTSTNPTSIEYLKADGTIASTVTLPSATGATALTVSSSSLDGQISRSADGKYLLVPGYNLAKGTDIGTGDRIVGRLAATGAPDLSTKVVGTGFAASNFRGVASADGTTLFVGGAAGGIYSTTFGNSTTAAAVVSATPTNTRGLNVYGGDLYVSTGATPYGLFDTPISAPTTVAAVAGWVTTQAAKPQTTQSIGFSSTGGTTIDIIYAADEDLGVQKWTLTGTTWSVAETFATGGAIGITGTYNAATSTATLYSTTYASGDATQLYTFTDTATNKTPATPTKFGAAGTANLAYRGVALPPSGL